MSLFSETLKQLVEAGGGNVYRLAKQAQIDRTTIHKAMSGDRLPNDKFLEKLCSALQLTPSEKTRLFEYYSIARFGESKYKLRNRVKSIVELLGTIPVSLHDSEIESSLKPFQDKAYPDVRIIQGGYAVGNMIREIIEKEVFRSVLPEICLILPANSTYIYGLLYSLYQQFKGKIRIRHIMGLRKLTEDMSGCSHNLDMLSVIAPFALLEGDGYKPVYFYGDGDLESNIIIDAPYRIITGTQAVSLSADYHTAILYSNSEMVNYFRSCFGKAESASIPFFLSLKDHSSLVRYMSELGRCSGAWCFIKPQPCFRLTPEQLGKKMILDAPGSNESAMIQMKRLERQSAADSCGICVFSMEGLERFAKSGYIDDMPKLRMLPFTQRERQTMLADFRHAVDSGTVTAVAADSTVFKIFNTVSITLNSEGLNLVVVSDDGGSFRLIIIKEESIKAAFRDFFASLLGSGLALQKSEMLQALSGLIEMLSATQEKDL